MNDTSPRIGHRLEAAAAGMASALFRALPLDAASWLGGRLARTLGPLATASRRAEHNLRLAFPHWSDAEIRAAVGDMWENLGCTVAEYPNLGKIDCYGGDRVTIEGVEHIDRLRDDGRPGIFFSGHLANWEIMPLAVAQRGVAISLVYRAANNPLVDAMILRARGAITETHVPKGSSGARQMLEIIRRGGHLGMLVDQKHSGGVAVPFFGRDAMTAPAIAQLALKFDLPLVPCRVVRRNGARFHVTVSPPMTLPRDGDRSRNTQALLVAINGFIEAAIRERPAHWMWMHRRWPED
jgi:KDO2-lipid IV(A) lauroyltransferase